MKLSEKFWKCWSGVKYLTVGEDVNYAFTEDGDTLYIWFQASASEKDWLGNFAFGKRPYKGMRIPYKVHGGFLKRWKQVEDIIIQKITEVKSGEKFRVWYNEDEFIDVLDYKFKHIITIGYSHGAALAGLCHECVWYRRPDIRNAIQGIGFAAPRFYKGRKVDSRLVERWENFLVVRVHNDIVTHLPPRLFGFTHVGLMLHLQPHDVTNIRWPRFIYSHHYDVIHAALKEWEAEE